jgi:hypothetical protein
MLRNRYVLFALVLACTMGGYSSVRALPADPGALRAAAPASDIQLARVVAGRGPGGRGFVAGRGPRGRGFVAGRGPGGRGFVAGGGRRIGGRYYGGIWYGTGRRFWGGRWWPYGVGRCWRSTPIGFVWICG